jgi:hypothetical protein
MGLDYIRSAPGKSFRKRWTNGLNLLKTPSLLDVSLGEHSRLVTATLMPGRGAKPGDRCMVQLGDTGDVLVFDGHRHIACITNPPPGLTDALKARHGITPAAVERVSAFGDTVELRLT